MGVKIAPNKPPYDNAEEAETIRTALCVYAVIWASVAFVIAIIGYATENLWCLLGFIFPLIATIAIKKVI